MPKSLPRLTKTLRSKAAPVVRRRPGGRSQRVGEAVSAVVVERLVAGGLDAVSVGEVAQRAGVNPTSIYRRWGNREALVTAVLLAEAEGALTVPDTGSLRQDLYRYLQDGARFIASPFGGALLQLAATALSRPDLERFRDTYVAGRLAPIKDMLARAVERGEIRPGTDPVWVLESLVGPLFARRLFTARPLDASLMSASVDQLLAALEARTGRRPRLRAR